MSQIKQNAWSLADIEQRTGLTREVLRKWELRYQFPLPMRGPRGQRLFCNTDLRKLQLIARLQRLGRRVSTLMPLNSQQLQALLDADQASQQLSSHAASLPTDLETLLATLQAPINPMALIDFLHSQIKQWGLNGFVEQRMPAYIWAVGDAWATQRIGIYAEHYFSDTLRQIVVKALPTAGHSHTPPRVLLSTPPTELHTLGLLTLHAHLALQGADCINLGSQIPVEEVLHAVREMRIQVVALSISSCMLADPTIRYLSQLRQELPTDCALWVGGQGSAGFDLANLPGCQIFTDTASAVRVWLEMAKAWRAAML
jgi:DNA-binding transcriptional MerR regulator/methylmalonyl-CoA mutase cobalamin-binding subunit